MDAIDYIPKLIKAGLDNDKRTIESVSLTISRKLKKERPDISSEISSALATTGSIGSFARSISSTPLPVDRETRFALLEVEDPCELENPIVGARLMKELDDFLKERSLIDRFYEDDIEPSNSILFVGQPGVGKTYTAHWLAYKLSLPLLTLNLATSISSYLGRSGQNIKSVFDFARSRPCILLLDEFDAIAKRRDDESDLGELKRLVNVLLKEIESCPKSSIVLAATNHPELLDRAMWRRFDRIIELELPGPLERRLLIARHLPSTRFPISTSAELSLVARSEGLSAADICKMCEHIKRQVVMNPDERIDYLALVELYSIAKPTSRSNKKSACVNLKKEMPDLSTREIARIVGVSASSVSRYLKDGE